MAERMIVPLAELMAVAGLDTRNFDEALNSTLVKLDNLSDRVLTSQQVIKELGEIGALAGKQYQDFGIALQLVSEQMAKNTEAARMEKQSLEATNIMAQQRIDLAEAEMASRLEYSNLIKQLTYEEQTAENERFEQYVAEDDERSRRDGERLARIEAINQAIKAASISEAAAVNSFASGMQSTLPFMSGYGESGGSGGGGGGGGRGGGSVGMRMGSGGINPYFRVTESIAATLGPLMDVIFPIALLTLGIDLWERFSGTLQNLISTATGAVDVFDQLEKSTKKMYDAKEAEVDQNERIRTQARRLGISETDLRRQIGGISTPGTRELDALKNPLIDEKKNLDSIAAQLKSVPTEFGRNIAAKAMGTALGMTDAQDLTEKRVLDRQKEVNDKIEELTKHKVKIQTEEAESIDRVTRAHKKWHDVVHELPNRLPWFMSAAPYAFGAPAFGAQTTGGGGNIAQAFSRSAPSNRGFAGSAIPSRTTTTNSVGPSGGSKGITIINNYTFSPRFDGVPADIQSFARDKMEPMIIDDLEKNTRGFTASIIDKLEKAGIRATK